MPLTTPTACDVYVDEYVNGRPSSTRPRRHCRRPAYWRLVVEVPSFGSIPVSVCGNHRRRVYGDLEAEPLS